MRRTILFLLAAAVLATPVLATPVLAADGLNMPEYRTVTLGNGFTVVLMRHATVPMVAFELWVDAGGASDPVGRYGLAALTAEALRKGAGDLDASGFAQTTDFLGADFGTSVNRDRTRVQLDLLSKDFETGLGLLADAVLRPRFDAEEIEKLAGRMSESVTEAKDNPRSVLGDYHYGFLFGDHPYGNPVDGTESSLLGVTRDEVVAFHHDNYGADRCVLAVVGDIDLDAAEAAVRSVFIHMPKAGSPAPEIPEPVLAEKSRVLLVNKGDTPQTWFMIGGLGPSYTDDDYAATMLVQTVFGGRFTSWLNTKLRIESGLTYGARYTLDRSRQAGPAYIMSFTATETTGEALELAVAQLDRLHDEGIGEADLASAKAYFKGQSPYNYETATDLAAITARFVFYGIDRARVDNLFRDVDAVTAEDCARVARKYFGRENLTLTAVGVREEVESVLGAYGEVTLRENSDPGFR